MEANKFKVKKVKKYSEMNTIEKNKINDVIAITDNVLAKKIYDYNKAMDNLINDAQVESKGRSL